MALTNLWVILGCGAVTLLSRVIPFALLKKFHLPAVVIDFLSFVPIAIMTALCCQSLFVAHAGHWATLNLANCYAAIPATFAGILSKSLLVVVVVGIMAMAVIRYFQWG
ncbi:MAG TPA: AzlD domain-containing protein [Candidatus Levilactobacillus faecigallinarum]|uniref:AzlD domain-containing protein n=1 Tax=Candidatus Levilactobacillus faecigallinarum TaxID=2838638 RepID=A0A9D1U4D1_9LACO|nr:AzlD domain-containing protein [Candidatus Levilactobacillus faecigallinarum]